MSNPMFKPLGNRIVVNPDEKGEKVTAGGIILPDTNKEKPVTGVVVVGNSSVKEGDRILFSKFGYDEMEIDHEIYYVVNDYSILGIFQ